MQVEEYKTRITELENKLRDQEMLNDSLKNVIELSVVGLLILDDQQRIIFANNTACLMLGLNKGELEGELFGMPVLPGKSLEITFIRQDHLLGKAEMHVVDSTYLEQRVQIISLHDITERKKLESYEIQLQLYEQQNCSISEFLQITVEKIAQITNSEVAFLSVLNSENENDLKGASHIFSSGLLMSQNQSEEVGFPDSDIEEIWKEILQNKELVIINNVTPSHSLADNMLTSSLALTRLMKIPVIENKRVVALVGVANKVSPYDESDVQSVHLLIKNALKIVQQKNTEQDNKNLATRLRQSQKMDALGQMAGGIAHDFNNMLGIIIGYAEMLEFVKGDSLKLAKYAGEISHAGKRGAKLTGKLLDFSRQTESKTDILDLNDLLSKQQHMLEKTLTVRISLIFELGTGLWKVLLDKGDMEDAILNLSINAMHAIKGSGSLRFQTHNESISEVNAKQLAIVAGDYVVLGITDTGCGMDDMTKERIFEPFFSTKKENGTGLGLSQVYGFAQRSNGAIKVCSEVGGGSEFVFYFPRYSEESNEALSSDKNKALEVKGSETILVVDDERSLLNLSKEILTRQGYKVFCAEGGKQALNVLESESIDLMFSDVIMPGMDGYQLAAIVKEKYPQIKIQLASGFSDNQHIKIIDKELSENILQKPFSSSSLLKAVRMRLIEDSSSLVK